MLTPHLVEQTKQIQIETKQIITLAEDVKQKCASHTKKVR